MLTLETLKGLKEGIFASGTTEIESYWTRGKMVRVKWVAVRGQIHDWAIYHSLDSNFVSSDEDAEGLLSVPNEEIARLGAKLIDKPMIEQLVKATPEAYSMYRF